MMKFIVFIEKAITTIYEIYYEKEKLEHEERISKNYY